VESGAVLLGVHTTAAEAAAVRNALTQSGATEIETANWSDVNA
jgi:hypothetical protein